MNVLDESEQSIDIFGHPESNEYRNKFIGMKLEHKFLIISIKNSYYHSIELFIRFGNSFPCVFF
jgi:hypothetical protein